MSQCTVCHKSQVPNNFLIQCISCVRSWHHRHHDPPIPDQELIAIIRAFNVARARNSDATLNWTCGACRKLKPRTVDPVPRPQTASTKDDPIVIDDDDVVEIVLAPVKPRASSHSNKSKAAKVAQPIRIIDDPVDFLVSPPADRPPSPVQRSSSSTLSLTSGIGHLSVSDNHQEPKNDGTLDHSDRTLSTHRELHSQRASTPSHPPESPQAQLKTSENQKATFPSSRARPQSAHQPSSSTIAPALAPPSVDNQASPEASRIKNLSFLERWATATVRLPPSKGLPTPPFRDPPPPFHPALLPHYINSRFRNNTTESESDKQSDIWYLAALGKSKAKLAVPGAQASSDPSHPRRSRKSRAVYFEAKDRSPNANARQVPITPFHFSVNTWMKKHEDALTSFEAIAK